MKNFNKITALLLSVGMIGSLAACGSGDATQPSTPPASGAPAASGEPSTGVTEDSAGNILAADGSFEIAMITDKGDINDKSFNQGTFDGVKLYAAANGLSYKYYQPLTAARPPTMTAMTP